MNTNKSCTRFPTHTGISGKRIQPVISAMLIVLAGLTAGCAKPHVATLAQAAPPPAVSQPQPIRVAKVTAIGYGASSAFDGYTTGQKRLMAMRASKLDAYRALAEQVQGVRVNGNSTVSAMMAKVDSFRVYVDAYLRGVQVVTVTPMEDGNYETTMELTLDDQFFSTFAQPQPVGISAANSRSSVGPGSIYGSNFYFSE